MNLLKLLPICVASFVACTAAADPVAELQAPARAPLPAHPELYSFADIYRLTVGAAAPAEPAPVLSPVRLAVIQPAPSAEPRFTVAAAAVEPGWALLLSGLALAGWVAHRRLVNPL